MGRGATTRAGASSAEGFDALLGTRRGRGASPVDKGAIGAIGRDEVVISRRLHLLRWWMGWVEQGGEPARLWTLSASYGRHLAQAGLEPVADKTLSSDLIWLYSKGACALTGTRRTPQWVLRPFVEWPRGIQTAYAEGISRAS
jgi:hypothetical protein